MKGNTLIRCVTVFIIGFSALTHATPRASLDALRMQRQALVGPQITKAPNYTVHVPGAVMSGSQVSCPTSFRQPAMSKRVQQQVVSEIIAEQEAIKRARNVFFEQAHEEYLRNIVEWNRQHKAGTMSKQELVDRVHAAEANVERIRNAPPSPEIQARIDALEARRAQAAQGSDTLILYLQHQPASPTETILPIQGDRPAQAFVQDLNRRLAGFLKTCHTAKKVITLHYYAQRYRPPRRDGRNETEVVNYTFAINSGRLVYQTPVQKRSGNANVDARIAAMQSGPFNWQRDPRHNRELTLAGFEGIAAEISADDSAREARRKNFLAEYRKDFEYRSKRKPGVVYFLDRHWQAYDEFDLPRRVFDGDFAYAERVEFKAFFMALADIYSKQCVRDPSLLRQYRIPYRDYAGSSWGIDGSRTVYQRDGTYTTLIYHRFTPHWGEYRPAVNTYWLSDFGNRSGEAKNLMRMSPKDFFTTLSHSGKQMFREHAQVERFIAQHGGCSSAAVAQLTENFVRAANGMPSAQSAGKQFANAAVESDPAPRN